MYYVGIALCVATIVIVVSNIIITQRYTENLKIDIKRYRYDAVKELVISGIWNSLNSLGNVLNSGLDLLVCTVMLTPVAMGQVSIAKSINSIFTGLYSMAATPFHPLFLKKYACGDKNGLIDQLVFSMKISGLVSNLAFAGFCALGKVYYKLWIPDQDIELISLFDYYHRRRLKCSWNVCFGKVYRYGSLFDCHYNCHYNALY